MNLIEEAGGFEEAGKPANGACLVLIVLVGRAHGELENIVEELGS